MERRKWIKQSLMTGGAALSSLFLANGMAHSSLKLSGGTTPTQPKGPFFPERIRFDEDTDLTHVQGLTGKATGEEVVIKGIVLDQNDQPVPGALIEVWQADHEGHYDHTRDTSPKDQDPYFQYWSRFRSDANGKYCFKTIQPGAYPATDTWIRPPHIHFQITKLGYRDLVTQMYFEGNVLNELDEILTSLPQEDQKKLIVSFDEKDGEKIGFFQIGIQKIVS